ncbi:hypothetical protein SAMN02910456_01815 [Ruminococcaceae bacterium YRB3002]|nr:hypothetical protein SAMN02910456_01815 [Ruminococcaceae bacterium YRB3002]
MNLMFMDLRPGVIGGLVVGVIVCGIFALICLKVSKKENASLEKVLSGVPEDLQEELKNQGFEKADGRDMFTSQALVASVDEDGDKVRATLLFWAEEHENFYTRIAKMSASEADSRGIATGKFVPVLMKYDKEMHYYDYKKLV